MSDMQHYTGMLLGNSNQAEVVRGVGGGKKSDERVVLEKNDRAPRLEELEKF